MPDLREPVHDLVRPSFASLSGLFFRVGTATFGGGLVSIVELGREMTGTRRWLKDSQYELAFAVARVTPGTNLIAFCAATGAQVLGYPGAVAAVMALTAPASIFALLLMEGFESGKQNPWMLAAVGGMVAAVAGMMWASVLNLAKPVLRGGLHNVVRGTVLGGGAFLASWKFGISPLTILAVVTLVAILWPAQQDQQRKAADQA